MILGIGVDIISVERIKDAILRWGKRFLERIYTDNEIKYCMALKEPHINLAGRFAAKEATYKALASYQKTGIRWREIEVIRGDKGAPSLKLYGVMKMASERLGVKKTHISISHNNEVALAFIIMEG